MTAPGWTLDELTAQVAAALNGPAYAGAPNGRVRDVPDARAIRWYATIGLVDRPAVHGRTAFYGPRHLLQLVAIKRRQSQGHRIADIQAELANAPDEVLRSIADLPATDRFWAAAPAVHQPEPPAARPPDLIFGVPLGLGVTVLLPGTPHPGDVEEIRRSAQPLLDLLAARGLTQGSAT